MKKSVIILSLLLALPFVVLRAQTENQEQLNAHGDYDYHDYEPNLVICYCAEPEYSEATKNFINRIYNYTEGDISIEEIDQFIATGANINAAYVAHYEGEKCGYGVATNEYTRPLFNLYGATLRHLIEKGADIELQDMYGNTLLLHLIQDGADIELIKWILERNAATNVSNYSNETPLTIAVRRNNVELVELLLKNKANPNEGILKKRRYPNSHEETDVTLLEYAAFLNQSEMVKLLLQNGADIENTRAHLIAAEMADKDDRFDKEEQESFWIIVQMIVEKGADVNAVIFSYETLLFRAIVQDRLDMVQYLMEHRANENTAHDYVFIAANHATPSDFRESPNAEAIKDYIFHFTETIYEHHERRWLHFQPTLRAIRDRDLKQVTQLLKENPTNINALDSLNNSTLHAFFFSYYVQFGERYVNFMAAARALDARKKLETEKDMQPMLELLLQNGADVNAVNINGKTPLHVAVEYGVPEHLITILLAHGADVNAKEKFDRTPLYYVRSVEVTEILIEYGADVNVISAVLKRTPLHTAAKRTDNYGSEIVQLLIRVGANESLKDTYGNIAFNLAKNNLIVSNTSSTSNPRAAAERHNHSTRKKIHIALSVVAFIVLVLTFIIAKKTKKK
jgi:ankyrin repeat protein